MSRQMNYADTVLVTSACEKKGTCEKQLLGLFALIICKGLGRLQTELGKNSDNK